MKVSLQIWDTVGDERYREINKTFYEDVAGVVYLYDITNEKSFYNLGIFMTEIRD